MLFLGVLKAGAQHYDRGYDVSEPNVFVPKGTWVLGGSLRYSQHINDNHSFLVISDINSNGYKVSEDLKLLYMFKDNMGAGLRVSYGRSMLDLESANLSVSEISMSAKNCYQVNQKYSAYAVYRSYIPFSGTKRIALYADLLFGGSYKQGKAFNAGGPAVIGSYQQSSELELAVDPGMIVFLTERLALELNVGVFGISYRWTDQVHNQASRGDVDLTSAGFMVNLLSLGVGITYYFL